MFRCLAVLAAMLFLACAGEPTVQPPPSPPPLTVTSAPSQQAVNIPAQFRFTVTDSGFRDMHTMKVEWGDGTSDSTALDSMQISDSLIHAYHRTGSYQLKMIARDDDGGVT